MNIFSKLFSDKELIEGGACPNCWGEQEYDGIARSLIKDKQIDIKNKESKHAFIKDFVINQVTGIYLQKGDDGLQCTRCKKIA